MVVKAMSKSPPEPCHDGLNVFTAQEVIAQKVKPSTAALFVHHDTDKNVIGQTLGNHRLLRRPDSESIKNPNWFCGPLSVFAYEVTACAPAPLGEKYGTDLDPFGLPSNKVWSYLPENDSDGNCLHQPLVEVARELSLDEANKLNKLVGGEGHDTTGHSKEQNAHIVLSRAIQQMDELGEHKLINILLKAQSQTNGETATKTNEETETDFFRARSLLQQQCQIRLTLLSGMHCMHLICTILSAGQQPKSDARLEEPINLSLVCAVQAGEPKDPSSIVKSTIKCLLDYSLGLHHTQQYPADKKTLILHSRVPRTLADVVAFAIASIACGEHETIEKGYTKYMGPTYHRKQNGELSQHLKGKSIQLHLWLMDYRNLAAFRSGKKPKDVVEARAKLVKQLDTSGKKQIRVAHDVLLFKPLIPEAEIVKPFHAIAAFLRRFIFDGESLRLVLTYMSLQVPRSPSSVFSSSESNGAISLKDQGALEEDIAKFLLEPQKGIANAIAASWMARWYNSEKTSVQTSPYRLTLFIAYHIGSGMLRFFIKMGIPVGTEQNAKRSRLVFPLIEKLLQLGDLSLPENGISLVSFPKGTGRESKDHVWKDLCIRPVWPSAPSKTRFQRQCSLGDFMPVFYLRSEGHASGPLSLEEVAQWLVTNAPSLFDDSCEPQQQLAAKHSPGLTKKRKRSPPPAVSVPPPGQALSHTQDEVEARLPVATDVADLVLAAPMAVLAQGQSRSEESPLPSPGLYSPLASQTAPTCLVSERQSPLASQTAPTCLVPERQSQNKQGEIPHTEPNENQLVTMSASCMPSEDKTVAIAEECSQQSSNVGREDHRFQGPQQESQGLGAASSQSMLKPGAQTLEKAGAVDERHAQQSGSVATEDGFSLRRPPQQGQGSAAASSQSTQQESVVVATVAPPPPNVISTTSSKTAEAMLEQWALAMKNAGAIDERHAQQSGSVATEDGFSFHRPPQQGQGSAAASSQSTQQESVVVASVAPPPPNVISTTSSKTAEAMLEQWALATKNAGAIDERHAQQSGSVATEDGFSFHRPSQQGQGSAAASLQSTQQESVVVASVAPPVPNEISTSFKNVKAMGEPAALSMEKVVAIAEKHIQHPGPIATEDDLLGSDSLHHSYSVVEEAFPQHIEDPPTNAVLRHNNGSATSSQGGDPRVSSSSSPPLIGIPGYSNRRQGTAGDNIGFQALLSGWGLGDRLTPLDGFPVFPPKLKKEQSHPKHPLSSVLSPHMPSNSEMNNNSAELSYNDKKKVSEALCKQGSRDDVIGVEGQHSVSSSYSGSGSKDAGDYLRDALERARRQFDENAAAETSRAKAQATRVQSPPPEERRRKRRKRGRRHSSIYIEEMAADEDGEDDDAEEDSSDSDSNSDSKEAKGELQSAVSLKSPYKWQQGAKMPALLGIGQDGAGLDAVYLDEREKQKVRHKEAQKRASSLMQQLSAQDKARLLHAWQDSGLPTDVIVQAGLDSIKRGSIQRLLPGQWLNDEVMNYFWVMLSKRDEEMCSKDPSRKRCHFMKSFFITKLLNVGNSDPTIAGKYDYENVKRWLKLAPGTDTFHWCPCVYFCDRF
jgi:hypothetical protein